MAECWERVALSLLALLCLSAPLPSAQAQVSAKFCGPLHTPPAAPPWDYRRDKHFHALVENAHFTSQVEYLIKGDTGNKVGPDLDYTLNRFPNHPRALMAVMKLGQKFPDPRTELLPRPVECYFERGIRFAPDDLVVRMIYARFLHSVKRLPEALQQLALVESKAEGNALTHRSLGLLYLEMQEYEKALEQAWRFEVLEPGVTTLRDALVQAGRWREPPAPSAAASAASSASDPASGASAP